MFDFLKREIRVTRNIDECNKIRELLLENNIQTYVITNTLTNPGRGRFNLETDPFIFM